MSSIDSAHSLEPAQRWGAIPLVCWIVLLVVSLVTLSGPAIERTQEARVLVTAREMMDRPIGEWNVPTTNGVVRLRKPPLAYWMAAGSMKVLGAHDWAGRLPFALCAWGTVGVLAMIGRRLINPRTGMLAGLMLAGTWLLAKFARLAETDTAAMFFVTLGVWAMLESIARPSLGAKVGWWIVLGIAGAGAALVKGPPAAYLLVIGIVLTIARDRRLAIGLILFVILTILPIGLWYLSIRHHPELGQLEDDLANSAGGGKGHSAGFWTYFEMIPHYALPWAGLLVLALAGATVRAVREREYSLELLTWSLAIFVPLCAWGNKQFQYLTVLYPPLMLITAWWLDLWLAGRLTGAWAIWTRVITMISTLGTSALVPRRRVPMLVLWTMVVVMAWSIWIGYVAPHLQKGDARVAAREIQQQAGEAELVFFEVDHLPLCFYLHRTIPAVPANDYYARLKREPALVGLERDKPAAFSPLPAGFREIARVRDDDRSIRLVRYDPAGN